MNMSNRNVLTDSSSFSNIQCMEFYTRQMH